VERGGGSGRKKDKKAGLQGIGGKCRGFGEISMRWCFLGFYQRTIIFYILYNIYNIGFGFSRQ
jgi:hypothetical protein